LDTGVLEKMASKKPTFLTNFKFKKPIKTPKSPKFSFLMFKKKFGQILYS